jgi:hypothetical protein
MLCLEDERELTGAIVRYGTAIDTRNRESDTTRQDQHRGARRVRPDTVPSLAVDTTEHETATSGLRAADLQPERTPCVIICLYGGLRASRFQADAS